MLGPWRERERGRSKPAVSRSQSGRPRIKVVRQRRPGAAPTQKLARGYESAARPEVKARKKTKKKVSPVRPCRRRLRAAAMTGIHKVQLICNIWFLFADSVSSDSKTNNRKIGRNGLVEGTAGNINLSLGLSVYHIPSTPALPVVLLAVIAAALHFLLVPLFDEDLFVPRLRQKHDATYSNLIQLRCRFLMRACLCVCACACIFCVRASVGVRQSAVGTQLFPAVHTSSYLFSGTHVSKHRP